MNTPQNSHWFNACLMLVAASCLMIQPQTAIAQKAPINIFEQEGVGILAVTNKHPVDIFVGVDGNWQGRVPARTTAYMPVEGFVTRDSGFDAEGNLNIKHAFGGFLVKPKMQLDYRSVTPIHVPDPANPGKTKPVWIESLDDPMYASTANAQGILWHIVGDGPYDLDPILLERMVKMDEGTPGPQWEKIARQAGEPIGFSQQEATNLIGGTSSGGGSIRLYGYRTITAQLFPASGQNVVGNRVEINGKITGLVRTDKLVLRSSSLSTPIEVKVSPLNADGSYSFSLDPLEFPLGQTTVELVANGKVVATTSFACVAPQPATPVYVPTYSYDPIPDHGSVEATSVRSDPIQEASDTINIQVNEFLESNQQQTIQTMEIINPPPFQQPFDYDDYGGDRSEIPVPQFE